MEDLTRKPYLIQGKIMHKRFFPKENKFNYKSNYICFPISKITKLNKLLFSIDKFNLFGLSQKQYGHDDNPDISHWIKKTLKENKIKDISDIILVTHPKLLGYVFNPVSFWLCLNKNKELIAVLSEVNNTCGQKHSYLCFKDDNSKITNDDWLEAKKEFYVSPFMEIEGKYKFKFEYENEKLNFYINYFVGDKLKLTTYLKCKLKKFSNRNLIISFIKIPFFTFKTILLIHYQAIKLYFKSIKYFKCPALLKNNLTIGKNAK